MKKLLIIVILSTVVITACKNTEKGEETEYVTEVEQEQEDGILSTAWMKDIALDNGAKWDANLETTYGVLKMQDLLMSQSTNSVAEYHELAKNLTEVKNDIVKECTMKGASHDNLHIWLYPLIEKIGALSETGSLKEASKIKESIIENLHVYDSFFQ